MGRSQDPPTRAERRRREWEPAVAGRQTAKAAAKRAARPDRWWSLFVAGLVLATLPEAVTGSRAARGGQTLAADGVLAAVALNGAVVLASGLTALPAPVDLALVSGIAPGRIGRAVRKGRRLRAAASGETIISPSAERRHGRHRA
jgi:hypothetical protein